MMFGKYKEGNEDLPRVLHISVVRYNRNLPRRGDLLKFLISIHEEGTGITWQQNVIVPYETERFLLDKTQDLYFWSLNRALTPKKADKTIHQLGKTLYDSFIGREGEKIINTIPPTAVLLNIDETILNLPWELMEIDGNIIAHQTPFGRLVTTRIIPLQGRDPKKEDDAVNILAIANPNLDLKGADQEIEILKEFEGNRSGFSIKVDVLTREKATKGAFAKMLTVGNYDIIHFSGHGKFDPKTPEKSAIRFSDGLLSADDILSLKWKSPPYLVFNSACESGRVSGGQRLVSDRSHSNGLATAFIAVGVSAYIGYFWPVTDTGAKLFSSVFYKILFERENIGTAFLEARKYVVRELGESGDLTGFSAVLYGDAASKHRRDLVMAK
jgi:CHAT domain-containing protein